MGPYNPKHHTREWSDAIFVATLSFLYSVFSFFFVMCCGPTATDSSKREHLKKDKEREKWVGLVFLSFFLYFFLSLSLSFFHTQKMGAFLLITGEK